MAHKRYYQIDATDPNINEIMSVCIGYLNTQRPSIDKTKLIVKLPEGDHNDYDFLAKYPELDHDKALELVQTSEWTETILK